MARYTEDSLPVAKRKRFFKTLAETGIVLAAAQSIGITTALAYRMRSRDMDWAEQWQQAMHDAADLAEMELNRRALGHVWEPVVNGGRIMMIKSEDGTEKMLMQQRVSDRLLELLLKAARPEKFGDMANITIKALPEDLVGQPKPVADPDAEYQDAIEE